MIGFCTLNFSGLGVTIFLILLVAKPRPRPLICPAAAEYPRAASNQRQCRSDQRSQMEPEEFKKRAAILRRLADEVERGEKPTATPWDLSGLSRTRLREIAKNVENAPGARQRELQARYLLLCPEQLRLATHADRQALKAYLKERTWESMRETDPAMHQTLAEAVAKVDPAMLDRV